MNHVIINIGLKRNILNAINSITRFHEHEYWNFRIYISNSITRLLELRDYKYWTYKIYFKLKI